MNIKNVVLTELATMFTELNPADMGLALNPIETELLVVVQTVIANLLAARAKVNPPVVTPTNPPVA